MNPILIGAIVQLIIQLVKLAEAFYTSPKSGPDKFSFVANILKALFSGAKTVTTGGAAETVAEVEPLIEPLINVSAAMLFPSKEN